MISTKQLNTMVPLKFGRYQELEQIGYSLDAIVRVMDCGFDKQVQFSNVADMLQPIRRQLSLYNEALRKEFEAAWGESTADHFR